MSFCCIFFLFLMCFIELALCFVCFCTSFEFVFFAACLTSQGLDINKTYTKFPGL